MAIIYVPKFQEYAGLSTDDKLNLNQENAVIYYADINKREVYHNGAWYNYVLNCNANLQMGNADVSVSNPLSFKEYSLGTQIGVDQTFVFANSAPKTTTKMIRIAKPTNIIGIYDIIIKNLSVTTDLTVTIYNVIPSFPSYSNYSRIVGFGVPRASLATIDTCFSYTAAGSGAYVDETADINNATTNDVAAPPIATVGDAIYFGDNIPFNGLSINMGRAGAYVGTIVWEYWSGSEWRTLTVTDNTNGFKALGRNFITFDEPNLWATVAVNNVTKYWVRARCSAVSILGTIPLITQGWIMGIRSPICYENFVQGMFGDSDVIISISNNTALGTTEGFSGYVRVREYK